MALATKIRMMSLIAAIVVGVIIIVWIVHRTVGHTVSYTSLEEDKDRVCKSLYTHDHLPERYQETYVFRNIVTKEECAYIIAEAEAFAAKDGWKNDRHDDHPTIDNEIDYIPKLKSFMYRMVYERIIPRIEYAFNLPKGILGINELFVVKYNIGGQTFLEPHQDGSEFSFVLVLNDEFEGGGTYFVDTKKHYDASVGSVVAFCGQNMHMGKEITKGVRYILAGFLNLGFEDRCSKYT